MTILALFAVFSEKCIQTEKAALHYVSADQCRAFVSPLLINARKITAESMTKNLGKGLICASLVKMH